MQLRFAIFYIGSLLAVAVILSALLMKRAGTPENKSEQAAANRIQKSGLEKLESAKERIGHLQQLDSMYLSRLMNILLKEDLSGVAASIDVVNRQMPAAEHALQLLSDNLQKTPGDSIGQQLFHITRQVMSHHQDIRTFASQLQSIPHSGKADSNRSELAAELMKKEQHIMELEEQLKIQRNASALQQKTSLPEKSADADTSYWSGRLETAKNDNEKLNRELVKYRNLAASETAMGKDRQTELVKKITELTNELYLSQVDCNLQRADSKQIIYTSRQRKELLDEALKILNNLSLSANADIQQKVRQKTRTLEAISNTVRD